MHLHDLLNNHIVLDSKIPDITVTGLALDSRYVKPGDLFFAYPGTALDRRQFIDQVIQQGASVVLKEPYSADESITIQNNVPIIPVSELASKVSIIADRFYGSPSKKMHVVGITGTNGKTSCGHLIAQAIEILGQKTGILGTIGYGRYGALTKPTLTTPDPITLQSIFYDLMKQNVTTATMEASSHALAQDRLASIHVTTGIFTNLTRDHLDYHKTMENYARAKHKLFEMPDIQRGIFNIDDPIGLQWIEEFHSTLNVCGFSLNPQLKSPYPVVIAQQIESRPEGLRGVVQTPWGEGTFESRLLGRFNMFNLLAVIATLGLQGYDLKDVLSLLPHLSPIPGRMQTLGGGKHPLVVIDFAHSSDALIQVLKALKPHCQGKLICLFGCGGNRDRGKRPLMGQAAETFADQIIITNDNVRFEDPQEIIQDIVCGLSHPQNAQITMDREQAIQQTLQQARPEDIILIAGKGHEEYTIIGEKCIPFSEIAIINKVLSED